MNILNRNNYSDNLNKLLYHIFIIYNIKTKMLGSNNMKKTALLVVAVFATVMIMGPSISGHENVLRKTKVQ